MKPYFLIDVQTTGFKQNKAIRTQVYNLTTNELSTFYHDSGEPIEPSATEFHGITNEYLKAQKTVPFKQMFESLLSECEITFCISEYSLHRTLISNGFSNHSLSTFELMDIGEILYGSEYTPYIKNDEKKELMFGDKGSKGTSMEAMISYSEKLLEKIKD